MTLRCLDQVFSTHRGLWFGVGFIGYCLALADAGSVEPTFSSVPLNEGWVGASDPNKTSKEKPPGGGFTKCRSKLHTTFLLNLKFTLSKKTAIVCV
jgi:hypothetical protein